MYVKNQIKPNIGCAAAAEPYPVGIDGKDALIVFGRIIRSPNNSVAVATALGFEEKCQ